MLTKSFGDNRTEAMIYHEYLKENNIITELYLDHTEKSWKVTKGFIRDEL